jgi:hypothetical protein
VATGVTGDGELTARVRGSARSVERSTTRSIRRSIVEQIVAPLADRMAREPDWRDPADPDSGCPASCRSRPMILKSLFYLS